MTVQVLLAQAKQLLSDTLQLPGAEAAIESQLLLRHVLGGVSRAWLISNDEQALTQAQQSQFNRLLARRLQGEPIAYIFGEREFYGIELKVTPDVLIPRPDTETLVEAALAKIPENGPWRVLDLGTGSGAIAIAIGLQRPQSIVTAIDQSPAAVAVAHANASRLQADNVRVLQSNWYQALSHETFELIVSNPPYIATDDPHLSQGDLRFEPPSALASGKEGLDDIRYIISQAQLHLVQGGWLMLEHGYDQAEGVADLLSGAGFDEVSHKTDLAGILRVTVGRKA